MKAIQLIIAALAIVATAAVFFCIGRKYEYNHFGRYDYEAACRMSDVIRCYQDHVEDSIYDKSLFEEVRDNFLMGENGIPEITLETYVWAY